jgi:hypothetical protein
VVGERQHATRSWWRHMRLILSASYAARHDRQSSRLPFGSSHHLLPRPEWSSFPCCMIKGR